MPGNFLRINICNTPDNIYFIDFGTESEYLIERVTMTKKLSPFEKKNRKPASKACVFCHSKHLQCSNERPCKNCIKRNIGDQCHDVVRKRAKYLNTSEGKKKSRTSSVLSNYRSPSILDTSPSLVPTNEIVKKEADIPDNNMQHIQGDPLQQQKQHDTQNSLHYTAPGPAVTTNMMLDTTNDVLNKLLYSEPIDSDNMSLRDSISEHHELSRSRGSIDNVFNSNYLNQEYLMLGDIILHSKPSSPSPSNTSASEYTGEATISPANTLLQGNSISLDRSDQNEVPNSRRLQSKLKDSRPFIALGVSNDTTTANPYPDGNISLDVTRSENEIMNLSNITANPPKNEYMSPLISHHIYQSVQDIYTHSIVNFDYPESYHLLTNFLKRRFLGNSLPIEEKQTKRNNLLIILKLIASYRPTFISAHKNLLKPYDLLFLEMSFQRSLIDYEKLLLFNSSPTIIWRRTGEIVSISNDLLSILGFNLSDILSKRTFIMELMYDDESIINYFKLFKSVAVGNLHLSIITKCKLMKNPTTAFNIETSDLNNSEYIEFCSAWTVKRDPFDIPMLIIGQFLPILPGGEGVRKY